MQNAAWDDQSQSIEEIGALIQEAMKSGEVSILGDDLLVGGGSLDLDDLDEEVDSDDLETSGDWLHDL